MYHKMYLVDSENVNGEWVDLLQQMGEQELITVFYTDKSTHVSCGNVCRLMQHGAGRVEWIKCFEGNNALDFQLVSELGAMVARKDALEYVIISKDNGYNAVVRYWQERGFCVTKQSGLEKGNVEPAVPEADKSKKKKKTSEAKAVVPEDFVHELLRSVNVMDNTMLYAVLCAFEGQDAGAADYRWLRDMEQEEKKALEMLLMRDKADRGVHYIRLLLRRNGQDEGDAEVLYQMIAGGPKKNLDKYRKALSERFGDPLGPAYYRITKGHYKCVKKL